MESGWIIPPMDLEGRRTVQQTIVAIKALGMSVRYNSETEEFRVNYLPTDRRCKVEATAYYIADADDALGTAKAMLKGGK